MTTKKAMTESQYIDELAKTLGKPKAEIKQTLAASQAVVVKGLKHHEAVKTPFGKFGIKKIPAQKGGKKAVNPFTKETYVTKAKPARKKVKFSVSGRIKKFFT